MTTTHPTPEAAVRKVLAGYVRPGVTVTPASLLDEDLGFDSLDRLEIGVGIECALDINLEDHALFGCTTVGSLIELASQQVAA